MRRLGELASLLHGRDYRRLLAVRVCSQGTDGLVQVALASYVLFAPERQATAIAVAAAFAALLVPYSLLGPFAGVLLDRWSRRQVLVVSNLVRTAFVLAMAATVAAGRADGLLFALVLATLSLNRFLLAALSAALPHVVQRAQLVLANAVTPTAGTLAFLAGLAVAVLLRLGVERAGGPGNVVVLIVAAGGYLAAAGLGLRIPRQLLGPPAQLTRPAMKDSLAGVVKGLREGLRYLGRRCPAAYGLAAIGTSRFCYGLSVLATVLLYRNYFSPANDPEAGLAGLSLAVLVSGAGFLSAALVTPYATRRIGKHRTITAALLLAAVVEVMPGAMYTVPTLLVAAFVLGLAAQSVKICVDTLVQEHVDDAFRGRAFAVYDVVFNAAFVLAAVIGAVIVPANGKSYAVVALVAGGYALTGLVYARVTAGQPPTPTAPRAPGPRRAGRAPSAAPAGGGRPHRPAVRAARRGSP